jgi:hypothetical protein
VRERFFTPRLRVASYEELNGFLLDRCIAYARAHKHPELTDRTIWQAFEAERLHLVPISGPFDGFSAIQASVSKTCLVRFDNNKYSVSSRAVGRPVEIQAYADRVVTARTVRSPPSRGPANIAAASAVARRFTTLGTMCRCSLASLVRCATVHRSETGCCRPIWSTCGVS